MADVNGSKRRTATALGIAAGGAATAAGIGLTLPFWVDQINQLRRARTQATKIAPEVVKELDQQIAIASGKIAELGGDVSALAPESAGANFVQPTNATVEENKPIKAPATESARPSSLVSEPKTTLSPGEITKNSEIDFPKADLGRRQIRSSGSRSLGVGDVGELRGTMDLGQEFKLAGRQAAIRTGAKLLGAAAIPLGVMAELEGKPLNAGEQDMIALTQHLQTLPEFNKANAQERRIMLDAAWTKFQEEARAHQEAARGQQDTQNLQDQSGFSQTNTGYVPSQGTIPPDQTQLAQQLSPHDPAQTPPQSGQQTPGLVAPPPSNHYNTTASGDGKIFEDEWPKTPGNSPAQSAAPSQPGMMGGAATGGEAQIHRPPGALSGPTQSSQQGQGLVPHPQGGGTYADTKQSTDTSPQEWNQLLSLMKSKNIQGFNWSGRAFLADDKMPSGYRVIFDREVAKHETPGTKR